MGYVNSLEGIHGYLRLFWRKIHHHSLGCLGQSFAEASPKKPEVGSDIKHRFWGFWVSGGTLPKFNMEPQNDGFQKESPIPGYHFGFHVKLWEGIFLFDVMC